MRIRYVLPDTLRGSLQDPMGDLVSEDEMVARINDGTYGTPIVCVGDVVAASLIERGIQPHLVVFDLITKRDAVGTKIQRILRNHPVSQTEVTSPPGSISHALDTAVKHALASPSPAKIFVNGEEDLAGLSVVDHGPNGGTMIYGMPDQGLVAVRIDAASKQRVRGLLGRMQPS